MAQAKLTGRSEQRRKAGRPPKLPPEQLDAVRQVALENPNATVDELRRLIGKRTGVLVTRETTYKYLSRAGVKRHKVRASDRPSTSRGKTQGRVKARRVAGTVATPSAQSSTAPTAYGYRQPHRDAGEVDRYPGCLTEVEWQLVADLFEQPGPGKPPKYPRKSMVNACCYVVRSGCPWRMLPRDFPPWQDAYAHFRRWVDKGLFEQMHDRLRAMWRQREGRESGPTAAIADSQSVKTSPQGGPKGFDAGKKVKGRKRHLVVDTLGLLLAVLVTPANVQDRDGAAPVVERAADKYPTLKMLYVDSAYSGRCADDLRARLKLDVEVVRRPSAAGAWTDAQLTLFTPAQRPFTILPKRWIVERTNSWVERPRRMAKDQDRRLDVATAWIWFTESRLLLRRLSQPVGTPTVLAA